VAAQKKTASYPYLEQFNTTASRCCSLFTITGRPVCATLHFGLASFPTPTDALSRIMMAADSSTPLPPGVPVCEVLSRKTLGRLEVRAFKIGDGK